jgi:hypothetical protein
MPELLTVSVGLPGGAVVLPVGQPPDEVPAWADRTARERLGEDAAEPDVAAFARVLTGAALDAARRDLITALAFCPEPRAGELARIEVSSVGAPDGAGPLTVSDVAKVLAGPTPESVEPAEVELLDLPIGPAARVRRRFARAGAEGAPPLTTLAVSYAARPPETDRAVILFVSWQRGQLTPQLTELTDRLARTLRMVPVD